MKKGFKTGADGAAPSRCNDKPWIVESLEGRALSRPWQAQVYASPTTQEQSHEKQEQ